MLTLCQGFCSECGYETVIVPNLYWAVIVEGHRSQFATQTAPNLVILPHPGENLVLKEIGVSMWSAFWQGRLVRVRNVFCKSCGAPYEIRRLKTVLGALTFLVTVIPALTLAWVWRSRLDLLLLVTAFLWMMGKTPENFLQKNSLEPISRAIC